VPKFSPSRLSRPRMANSGRWPNCLPPSRMGNSSAPPSSRSATWCTRRRPERSQPRSNTVQKKLPELQHPLSLLRGSGHVPTARPSQVLRDLAGDGSHRPRELPENKLVSTRDFGFVPSDVSQTGCGRMRTSYLGRLSWRWSRLSMASKAFLAIPTPFA
jgi:hypothetical protein